MNGEEKLKAFRKEMEARGYDAYVIPHGDQHDNEYIAEADERIEFISGFTGSNGIGLVTKDIALMWTDGRYFIQIEKELYPGWKMMKMVRRSTDNPTLTEYVKEKLPKGSKIAFDFNLFSKENFDSMKETLKDFQIIDDEKNLIDSLWKEKKTYPKDKVIIMPVKYAGLSPVDKYKKIGEVLKKTIKEEAPELANNKSIVKTRLLISRLDDIAWMTNLRGADIPYNPVFFSFGLLFVTENGEFFHLFSDKDKFETEEIKKHLEENKITLHDYNEIFKVLSLSSNDTLTVLDVESSNYKMFNIAESNKTGFFLKISKDIIEVEKSIKNPTEIAGYKSANVRDCVALTKFFAWIEDELVTKQRKDLNEYEIGLKNKACREEQDLFMGESFAPICGAGSNAAIIHYTQTKELHSDMALDKVILCDTGGQYMDGTTDITRTAHFGTATEKEKEFYTRVLLGNLSLERCIFKKGFKLSDLDSIPRSFLYQVSQDYLHGTSHGVGHFLNVHEGPYQSELKEGNVVTNEPGYYEEGAFGIRIENSVLVVKKGEDKLGFENLTLFPYERNLIDMNLLSPDMIKYIDEYHKTVWEKLSPFLKDDAKSLDYLKRKTAPLK